MKLVQDVTKKREALSSIQVSLSSTKVALTEAKHALKPSLKRVEELELSLKEAQDELEEIRIENLSLSKKYVFSLEESFPIVLESFTNALNQVGHFYPLVEISRESVHVDLIMEDRKSVSLWD